MRTLITLAACLLAAMPQAWAASTDLKPSQVFAADSPSIVVIVAYGEDGKAIALGSGVVIAKDTVVSNCHVVEEANTASVLYQKKRFSAMLRYADIERDLCSFTVKGLSAPPVRMGFTSQVQVGDAAYAIGAPEGLELTLSGGLISSLRHIPGGVVLQMTTPISPGSSGGGLFDSEGRLIGITSYYMAKGEQLNFALPVEWIKELPQRGKLVSPNTKRVTHASNAAQECSNLTPDMLIASLKGNYTQVLAWCRKAAAQGNPFAEDYLGMMYANGEGVPRSYSQALAWYRKAAAQGLAEAQCDLGLMYANGEGAPQDYAQAVAWFRNAAEQGYADAQYDLGLMYTDGHGVPQDYAQAVAWYRKAAAQGYAKAENNLGLRYTNGQGVPQDYAQAVAWYRKAATQGLAGAQNNLGLMYANGQGVPQDYSQAVAWFHEAAAQGNAEAQYNLGQMYAKGQGVPQDYGQAVAWWRKAVVQGSARAQNGLGVAYEFGAGAPRDYVVAYALFNLSASLDSSDDNPAATNRSKLMDLMTPEQITGGQALTREMQRIGVIKALDEYLNSGAQ